MTRPLDEPIPNEEELYRAFKLDHFEGQLLLPTALAGDAISVNRGRYSAPGDVLTEERRERGYSVVGFITPAVLPRAIQIDGHEWEVFAVDAPHEGDAHAELRWREKDITGTEPRHPRKPVRKAIRAAIAARFSRIESLSPGQH